MFNRRKFVSTIAAVAASASVPSLAMAAGETSREKFVRVCQQQGAVATFKVQPPLKYPNGRYCQAAIVVIQAIKVHHSNYSCIDASTGIAIGKSVEGIPVDYVDTIRYFDSEDAAIEGACRWILEYMASRNIDFDTKDNRHPIEYMHLFHPGWRRHAGVQAPLSNSNASRSRYRPLTPKPQWPPSSLAVEAWEFR